jgi:peptidoglycan/xylan/chitin deacetylase (PgdA/CDA1 family)
MNKLIPAITSFFLLTSVPFHAQTEQTSGKCNNHKAAVVLTYDDAINVHLDKVVPALDAAGMKGTFYVPGNAPALSERLEEWRQIPANGHELGNHTLYHPCDGSLPGRDWVQPDQDLSTYSFSQMT